MGALEDVARREQLTLTRLIERIDARRLASGDDIPTARLTPAIRVFLLSYYPDIAEGGSAQSGELSGGASLQTAGKTTRLSP